MKDKNMTIHKLAQKSNVAYATVYSIVHEKNSNPNIETLQKIARALEVNIHSLLKGGVMMLKRVILKIRKKRTKNKDSTYN